jgi:rubrerythrin
MPLSEYVDLAFKGIVAALVPLGWAAIFYPLMRKLKKGWPALLIVATLLSLSLFVIKEVMDSITPAFDEIVTYTLGIFFGGAVLSLFFNYKSRWLRASPKKGTFLHNPKGKNNIHLRHLLRVAISIEEEGENFYDNLAENAENPDVRNLCRKLAVDEVRHRQYFQKTLNRWLSIPADMRSLDLLKKKLRKKGIFSDPPPLDVSEEGMIKYAIEQENKTADFYLSFENSFPDAWKKMHVERLVEEEKEHAKKLMALS